MAVVDTNWKIFLSPDSNLPPDAHFLVKGGDEGDKKIAAHKFLLAGTSSVFHSLFFGPLKDNVKEVEEVENTTPEAFDTMINYIYRLPGEETFNLSTCPQKLFELFELAERYQIPKLKTVTASALETLDISRENMMFTATVAQKYKEIFGDLSKKLLLKCLEFLFQMTRGAGDILALIMETKDSFPEANMGIFQELTEAANEILQVPGMSN